MQPQTHLAIPALLFTLVAPPGYAHGGDAALIHACVHEQLGLVRIVEPNQTCRRFETPLHWTRATSSASQGGPRGVQLFESDASFTVPANVTSVVVELWGGGGAAGVRSTPLPMPPIPPVPGTSTPGGGGGGGYVRTVVAVSPGQTIPVTVGAGGAALCGLDGAAGGDTLFGALAMAGGGRGGTVTGLGGAGGTASAAGIATPGQNGPSPLAARPNAIGLSAQGTYAPPGTSAGSSAPGKGGISIPAPGTENCMDITLQFATGQAGQVLVQW